MPKQHTSVEKLAESTQIPKPPAPSPGTRIRVAGVGKLVNDAPEADRGLASLAHRGHDLRGERVLDACQLESIDLRSVLWSNDECYHALTTQSCWGRCSLPIH